MDIILPLLLIISLPVDGQHSCSNRPDGRCETCDCKPDCFDLSDELYCTNGSSIRDLLHPPYWTKDSKADLCSGQKDKFFPPPPLPPFPLCPESLTSRMPPIEFSRTASVVASTSPSITTRTKGTISVTESTPHSTTSLKDVTSQSATTRIDVTSHSANTRTDFTSHSANTRTDFTSYSATSQTDFTSHSATTRADFTSHSATSRTDFMPHSATAQTDTTSHSTMSEQGQTTHFIQPTGGATSWHMTTKQTSPTTQKTSRSPCMRVAHYDRFCQRRYRGFYSHPVECEKYIVCEWGEYHECHCPPLTRWNGRVCIWKYMSPCVSRDQQRTLSLATQDGRSLPKQTRQPKRTRSGQIKPASLLPLSMHLIPQVIAPTTVRQEQIMLEYQNSPLVKKTRPPMAMHPSRIASLVESFTKTLSLKDNVPNKSVF